MLEEQKSRNPRKKLYKCICLLVMLAMVVDYICTEIRFNDYVVYNQELYILKKSRCLECNKFNYDLSNCSYCNDCHGIMTQVEYKQASINETEQYAAKKVKYGIYGCVWAIIIYIYILKGTYNYIDQCENYE